MLGLREQQLFDQVYAARKRKPFVPFTLVLRDGKRYEVNDRWGMAMARGNPRVVVLVEEGSATDFFDWDDVAVVEEPSTAASGS
jgi:hypothetical protein